MSGVGLGLGAVALYTYEILYCNQVTVYTTHDGKYQIKDRKEKQKTEKRSESKLRKEEMRYVVSITCTTFCLVFQKPSCSSMAGNW